MTQPGAPGVRRRSRNTDKSRSPGVQVWHPSYPPKRARRRLDPLLREKLRVQNTRTDRWRRSRVVSSALRVVLHSIDAPPPVLPNGLAPAQQLRRTHLRVLRHRHLRLGAPHSKEDRTPRQSCKAQSCVPPSARRGYQSVAGAVVVDIDVVVDPRVQ